MSTSNFSEFLNTTNNDSAAKVNFLTPTFNTFKVEQPYLLDITEGTVSESKMGYYQIEVNVDAIDGDNKAPMGRVWVPTPLVAEGSEEAALLAGYDAAIGANNAPTPEQAQAAQRRSMNGQSLYSFLRAVAPDTFVGYNMEKLGKKVVITNKTTGAELTRDERAIIDGKLSEATVNFAQSCITGAGTELLPGLRFWYKLVPRKKDPNKTNQKFMLESEVHD